MKILVITNGDSAVEAISAAGIEAVLLPWRDVLHDGPVPAGLALNEMSKVRAKYLSSLGWGEASSIYDSFVERDRLFDSRASFDEVVLWFEHDLYDQLQLLQVLHSCSQLESDSLKQSVIFSDTFISENDPHTLLSQFENREPLTKEHLSSGARGWLAFTAPQPLCLYSYAIAGSEILPHMREGLFRFFEEYPATRDGLSRSERQILLLLSSGINKPGALFKASQDLEEAAFLGDSSFWLILVGLLQRDAPLVEAREPFFFPPQAEFDHAFLSQELLLTPLADAYLEGAASIRSQNPSRDWFGGVELGEGNIWRWDLEKQNFTCM